MAYKGELYVGTAGWGIPKEHAQLFPEGGSHLARYARVLRCAEINSSFYRPHRPSTYQRWAETTPEDFRFSVKLPKQISHVNGLPVDRPNMMTFLFEVRYLGEKLGPILVQLPPKQKFEFQPAKSFLSALRELHPTGPIAFEPRHKDWFSPEADSLLRSLSIARVIADPPPTPEATRAGGDLAFTYRRLHGSPRIYYSSYADQDLAVLSKQLRDTAISSDAWCIFDNTASGAAAQNAVKTRLDTS
jgi:uncharacterized protein YecE (DUF72 family)